MNGKQMEIIVELFEDWEIKSVWDSEKGDYY